MRIVIVNAFARGNRGDAALLSVAVEQLGRAFPGARLRIAGFEAPEEWPEFDAVPNLGSIRRWAGDESVPRLVRVSRKVLVVLLTALTALPGGGRLLRAGAGLLPAEPRREVRALAEADLVVSLGGGYLNGRADLASDISVALLLLPLWLAHRFGVRTVFAPQSFGPFPTWRQRFLVRRVLNAARLVVAREEISLARLAEAGAAGPQLVRGVDGAFAFRGRSDRRWRSELGVPRDAVLVLVTVRRFLAPAEQRAFEESVAGTLRHLLDLGCHVALAPQVTCAYQADDDRIANRRVAALVGDPRLHVLDDDTVDHHDVFALYGAADFVLGTRFHSVIFGLVSGVPCAAVEYDHKTRGIMRDLGLEQWVVRMDEVRPDELSALMDRLLAEAGEYRGHLDAVVPGYARRAEAFVELLRDCAPGAPPRCPAPAPGAGGAPR